MNAAESRARAVAGWWSKASSSHQSGFGTRALSAGAETGQQQQQEEEVRVTSLGAGRMVSIHSLLPGSAPPPAASNDTATNT